MVKRIFFLTILFVAVAAAYPQQPKETKPAKDAPPVVSAELRAKLFKIQAQQVQAQSALERAQTAVTAKNQEWQQVAAEVSAVCGTKYIANWDSTGDPVCVLKPEPAKPEKK